MARPCSSRSRTRCHWRRHEPAYVHVRRAPSTAAEAIGQRASGAELAADARQGPWLRLAGAGGWVLTRHPVYGALVEIF